jgi:ABC-type sugar transport system ATPase subunit
MRAIFGALPKLSGEVYIQGEHADIKMPRDAIGLGLGLLTEDRKKDGIVGTMTIGENMTLSILRRLRRLFYLDQVKERRVIDEYFSSLSIKAPSSRTSILNLSGGNQQKVVLAKSLMTDTKVLFLDEPTRGIDVGAKAEIYKIIKELSLRGLSIIMVSSEHPELVAMCDRFIVLGNGRVVGELNRSNVSEKTLIRVASFQTA